VNLLEEAEGALDRAELTIARDEDEDEVRLACRTQRVDSGGATMFDGARLGPEVSGQKGGLSEGAWGKPRHSYLPQRLHVETSSPKALGFDSQS
jgi:hypothetical protein